MDRLITHIQELIKNYGLDSPQIADLQVVMEEPRYRLLGEHFPVLDQGFVSLTGLLGSDQSIVNTARVSFLGGSKGDEADKKLLFYLMGERSDGSTAHSHTSPFEFVQFIFRIKAPALVWWHWIRQRTFSYCGQSGRYTEFNQTNIYVPYVWRKQAQRNKQGSEGEIDDEDSGKWTKKFLVHAYRSWLLYQEALGAGIAREQARLFLPMFAEYYTFYVRADAHNLMNFMKQRLDHHAQHEIRMYAESIYENIFKPVLPWTAEAFEKFIK